MNTATTSSCKLTICFEDPFWIGLIETWEGDAYRVARHVFGAEPTDPQVEQFVREHWRDLRFTAALQIEKRGGAKINPKRLHRIIEREIAANARRGTKAQQALAEQREAAGLARKEKSREQREAEKQLKFEKRTEKRKEKRRGH